MSIASDIRWVAARWPALTRYQLAKLLGTTIPNVKSALAVDFFKESAHRPVNLPPQVVDGAPLSVVQDAATGAYMQGSPARARWTQERADAAHRMNMTFQDFVEYLVTEGTRQVLGK